MHTTRRGRAAVSACVHGSSHGLRGTEQRTTNSRVKTMPFQPPRAMTENPYWRPLRELNMLRSYCHAMPARADPSGWVRVCWHTHGPEVDPYVHVSHMR